MDVDSTEGLVYRIEAYKVAGQHVVG